jgi:integrase/recombinase XerD
MWVEGTVGNAYVRRSLKTKSWERAVSECHRLEQACDPAPQRPRPAGITISDAVHAYLQDAKDRGLRDSTLSKLDTIFRKQFLTWAAKRRFTRLADLDVVALRDFRSSWKDKPLAKSKKQSRVMGFFHFCQRSKWISEHPMLGIGAIRVDQTPTDYFPAEEFERILDATERYRDHRGASGSGARIQALTLLMRWSGLRIRDAVTLEKNRLSADDKLLLYQAKTRQPVYVPLPPQVAQALRSMPAGPKPNRMYFFWSGNGLPKTAVADWQRSYRRLFKLADLRQADGNPKRCHPQMFRDTFAVEMLLAGVPLDQVSILLGHRSIKVTEKHYAPWVRARQEQLENSVRRAWENKLTPIDRTEGTLVVQTMGTG